MCNVHWQFRRMTYLNLFEWQIQTSTNSQGKCFLFKMEITRCKHGCYTSNVSKVRIHLGTYPWIPMSDGLVEFLTAMTNLNKYDIHLLHIFSFLVLFLFICSCNDAFFCKAVELDHVKSSLVHEFFQIHNINIIPSK